MKVIYNLLAVAILLAWTTVDAQSTVNVTITASFGSAICSGGGNSCSRVYCGGFSQPTCAELGYIGNSNGPVQSRWGSPVDNNRNYTSGLGFGAAPTFATAFDTDFFMGTMVHFNFPIVSGSAASSTQLTVRFNISNSITGQPLSVTTFTFTFLIDETSNSPNSVSNCPYPSTTPCSDKISYPNGGFDQNARFTVGQIEYTLQLKGFKESQSSTSLPLDSFISNENGYRTGYLFARITAACPTSCAGGGSVIISPDQRCICNCSTATPCTPPKTFTNNCTCACPNSCQNSGTLTSTCGCNCTNATPCNTPRVFTSDCGCTCPAGYCNTGTISNTTTCACTCPPNMPCGPNFVVNSTCLCNCPLSCPFPKIEDPDEGICGCICPNTCNNTLGYYLNSTNCSCDCRRDCPNGAIDFSNCTCGACTGYWEKNTTTNQCTVCGLTQDICGSQGEVDPALCQCICPGLKCNLTAGEVVDLTKPCDCRNCTAGECECGNGVVEPGEVCDPGRWVTDPCCVQCQYTLNPCDDGNLCTAPDRCDGNGQCVGPYKCPGDTTCSSYTCTRTIGTCDQTKQPDGSTCESVFGRGDANLCVQRCYDGSCEPFPPSGPLAKPPCVDDNTNDCFVPVCSPNNGSCVYVVVEDGTACSDNLACTSNDQCEAGVCRGVPVICDGVVNVTQCQVPRCFEGYSSYECIAENIKNGLRCDDGNNCTLIDVCLNGVCKAVGQGVLCPDKDQCNEYVCESETGTCRRIAFNDTACNDGKICTDNDKCVAGVCVGEETDRTRRLPQCGFIPPEKSGGGGNALIIFAAAGGAALIGAIIGAALIIKKIQKSKLLDPATWNPDMFNSVGTNPLFQASQRMVENPLHDAHN